MSDLWRWADPDGQQRTVRLDELRAALAGGLIAPNTPVWKTGWTSWQPAHEVPELSSASHGGANGVVLNIPPPPLAMLAVQQEYEAVSGSLAPVAPGDEPPPPPRFMPTVPQAASSNNLRTQVGGSAHVPAAPSVQPMASTQQMPQTFQTQIGGSPAPGMPPTQQMTQPMPQMTQPMQGLPTVVGVPPPPEVLALAAVKVPPRAKPQPPAGPVARTLESPAVPVGMPAARTLESPAVPFGMGPQAAPEEIEEISGDLLESASQPEFRTNGRGADPLGLHPPPAAPPDPGGYPAPTDPIVRESGGMFESGEVAGLPRRPGLSLIFDDIAAIRKGRPPKNKLLVGVLAVVVLSFVIMLIAGIASLFGGSPKSAKTAGSASPSGSPSGAALAKSSAPAASSVAAAAPATSATPPPEEPKGASFGDCTVSGEGKTIAPRAQIISAIEAHALGTGLALGFASAPRDAVATSLDATSLAPTATVRTKPIGGDAKRVTPLLVGGKLTAMPDVEKKGDRLGSRRIVAANTLIDVGSADGGIVWAPHGRDSFAKLFSLEGEGSVEALRAIALTDRKGIALAFRRGNSINVGVAKGDNVLDADGELSKIAGLGQVGSPAIAASGDRIIAAWADRAGANDDYGIRWAKIKIGSSTTEATAFALPEGGLGGQAMSPSIASLGGGRFLLAWTEGPVSNHQVRAMTIGSDGLPSGSALAISSAGLNAGQPAAVVGPDGRGAVAFLAAKGKTLEVHATPITCPPR